LYKTDVHKHEISCYDTHRCCQ